MAELLKTADPSMYQKVAPADAERGLITVLGA
jgi:hypothetical protein